MTVSQSIYYDREVVLRLQDVMSPFFKVPYRSNWRVLHIDGFENYPRLPVRQDRPLKFFESLYPTAELKETL